MNTIEQTNILSPFCVGGRAFGAQSKNSLLRQEVQRCLGTHNFTAEFREDTQMLEKLRIPGLVAFTCEIKRDGQIIAYGRGSSVLNRINKWPERSVKYARDSALLDGIIQSNRVLDTLYANQDNQGIAAPSNTQTVESVATDLISDKQKGYLLGLISKIKDKEEREREESLVDSLSKEVASAKINSLLCGA